MYLGTLRLLSRDKGLGFMSLIQHNAAIKGGAAQPIDDLQQAATLPLVLHYQC